MVVEYRIVVNYVLGKIGSESHVLNFPVCNLILGSSILKVEIFDGHNLWLHSKTVGGGWRKLDGTDSRT